MSDLNIRLQLELAKVLHDFFERHPELFSFEITSEGHIVGYGHLSEESIALSDDTRSDLVACLRTGSVQLAFPVHIVDEDDHDLLQDHPEIQTSTQ